MTIDGLQKEMNELMGSESYIDWNDFINERLLPCKNELEKELEAELCPT